MISFVVVGTPIPKGSVRAFYKPGMKHAVIVNDNARTKPWAEAVVAAAMEARDAWIHKPGMPVWDGAVGPVAVDVGFYLPRPKTAKKNYTRPTKKPDLDKLARNCLDALTRSGIVNDDAQVVSLRVWKVFAGQTGDASNGKHFGLPRAEILVRAL